jgi:quercetin dioxygenase-like cupin family protein
MTFIDLAAVPEFEPLPGVRLRTPHGRNVMLSHVNLDEGAVVPTHHHPHEQAGVILSGRLELTIAGETRVLEPGALYIIPADVPHAARAVGGPATVLDIFSPIREDYARRSNTYIPAAG